MKKIALSIIMSLVFLGGCQNTEKVENYFEDFSKAQEITVILSKTSDVINTITDKTEIEEFVSALDLGNWSLSELPKNAKEIGEFQLSQEETIKLGENSTDGTLYNIGKITLYEGSYIDLEVSGLNVAFKVSEDTADYLHSYLE